MTPTSIKHKRARYFLHSSNDPKVEIIYVTYGNEKDDSFYWNTVEWLLSGLNENSLNWMQIKPNFHPISIYQFKALGIKLHKLNENNTSKLSLS